jgi:ribokinase
MTRLAVTGYASLDYVMQLDGMVAPDQTTTGRRSDAAWPRVGGCPSYIAKAVARVGGAVDPVMWVGTDAMGRMLAEDLRTTCVGTDAVAMVDRARSPTALMVYQRDGSCAVLFDPGLAGAETLTDTQRAAITTASHLCISVGPPQLSAEILDLRAPHARLYWAVKNDPACFTPDIVARLRTEADVIFCSRAERELVGATSAMVIQTLGPSGVQIDIGDRRVSLPVAAIDTPDTTGAGDTFAGGVIAAEMAGACAPEHAAEAGIAAAAAMLIDRQQEATTS